MRDRVVYVVGDNLSSRSKSADLVSLSDLVANIRSGLVSEPFPTIAPGQGVEEAGREAICSELHRKGAPESKLKDTPLPDLLTRSEVHKHKPENILIAGLEKVEDDYFRANLRISDQQEMILDHTTGSHVTAMVITEAVRQISLAVGERYLLAPPTSARRFIINSLQTAFYKFLLPLPTQLDYSLEETNWKGPNRLQFRGRCDLVQAGVVTASGSMDMLVLEEERAEQVEERQIHETTRSLAELQ